MELNYLLLLPITITAMWILVFVINGRYQMLHDRLLIVGASTTAFTYYIVMHSLVEGTNSYHFILLDNIETLLGLSICPILFLYVRSVVYDSKWKKWYIWLFLPAVLITIAGTALSFAVGWDRILTLRIDGYHPFVPGKGKLIEYLYYIVNIQLFDITLEVMSIVMIALCVYYLARYSRKATNYYSNIKNASIDKIQRFLASASLNLIILFLLTIFILDIIGNNKLLHIVIALSVSTLLWIMLRNAYGIIVIKNNLEIIDSLPDEDNDYTYSTASEIIKDKLTKWLNKEEKPYCHEGITLADVANAIDVCPRTLSGYINKIEGVNFRRWINNLRIEEAKKMIEKNPEEKITYIATICGFADLPSFSKTFHKIEGCSPLEYKSLR